MALSYAVRSELVDKWIQTQRRYHETNTKRVYYLSMEYLFGRSLHSHVVNLGLEEQVNKVADSLNVTIDDIYSQEDDYELGNGGKGRLAACLQESMASHNIPAMGYGIRYEYALFYQQIINGAQIEKPHDWMKSGHPWEINRPERTEKVHFYGQTRPEGGRKGNREPHIWEETETVNAIAFDIPVPGYRSATVNTVRLFSARSSEEFSSDYQNHRDYIRGFEEKSRIGRLTEVLYPEEDVRRASDHRIKQQYFLISASLQDIIKRFKEHNDDIRQLGDKTVIHLNGSHCALAIPEMMRILVDIEKIEWDVAWQITRELFVYTSHAVSGENLEVWPVYRIEEILPRHMQIIYELNYQSLQLFRSQYRDDAFAVEMSVIEEGEVKRVRMAHLAAIGARVINGVSDKQSEILEKKVFSQIARTSSGKFVSVTNGVAHRRWLLSANPQLARLISARIGEGWITRPQQLSELEAHLADDVLCKDFLQQKKKAKQRLAAEIMDRFDIHVDSDMIFDVDIKKIHPYKRQMLHLLFVAHCYLEMKKGKTNFLPRLHIFSGKAMPSDFFAKQIIQLIHLVATRVNNDSDIAENLGVLFFPNYSVSLCERIVPAADVSEQIPTPGMEASGTANIKLTLNGAMTVASKSGSNCEMIKHIGDDVVFAFGPEQKPDNTHQPAVLLAKHEHLREVYSFLEEQVNENEYTRMIYPLFASLIDDDRYGVIRDFDEYCRAQSMVDELYANPVEWARGCLKGIARCGHFSIDRAVEQYAEKVWKL